MSQKITFYPVGNAETVLLELSNGKNILFDFADMNSGKIGDKRYKITDELSKKKEFDVVMFSHAHEDHVKGAKDFFEFGHSEKYKGAGRAKIKELWVSSAFILEVDANGAGLCEDARIIRQEARDRLKKGHGIRVFSKPNALDVWLKSENLSTDDSKHPIVHAGTLLKGCDIGLGDEVNFFVHAPFSADSEEVDDRNEPSIALQIRLFNDNRETNIFITGDTPHSVLEKVVDISMANGNEQYLKWDIYDVPHHCSYTGLADEEDADNAGRTNPSKQVKDLLGKFCMENSVLVASCEPIYRDNENTPPHYAAKKAYIKFSNNKEFYSTMEYPTETNPKPLCFIIDSFGIRIERTISNNITTSPAPRAG